MHANGAPMNINDSDPLYSLMFNDNMNRQLPHPDPVLRTDRTPDTLYGSGTLCMQEGQILSRL